MRFWSRLIREWPLLFVLVVPLLTTACGMTFRTSIGETDAAIVQRVCTAWLPVTYSSRDTEQTKIEAKANNAAREAFGCPR